jgi:hypothetical protein
MKYELGVPAGHPGYLPEKLIRDFFGIPRTRSIPYPNPFSLPLLFPY